MTTWGSGFMITKDARGETFRWKDEGILVMREKDKHGLKRYWEYSPGDTFTVLEAKSPTFTCEISGVGTFFLNVNANIKLGYVEHVPTPTAGRVQRNHQLSCNTCKKFSLLRGFCTVGEFTCSEKCHDPA